MNNKKYFYSSATVIIISSLFVLGWVYFVFSTTIGNDITTTTATTTGNFVVQGSTTLGTTTIGTNFYIDPVGSASTTALFTAANLNITTGATTSKLTVTGSSTFGTNFIIDSSGNASTTGTFIISTLKATNATATNATATAFGTLGTTTLATTSIGAGTPISKLLFGTVSLDLPSIAASSTGLGTTTLTGATGGMKCFLEPPFDLNDELLPKSATTSIIEGAGVIGAYVYNDGVVIDVGAQTWGYLCIQ